MKNMTKKLLAITMLLSTVQLATAATTTASTSYGQSFFLPRAQNGTAIDVLGWSPEIHKYDADSIYFDFKVQSEWRQSFSSSKLGEYIFFNGTNSMIFGPQNLTGTTNTTDIYSLNFLLVPGFQSTVTAAPKIQSSITDFSLYVGFDEWVSGLWLSAHLPLVYTRWNTNLTETVTTPVPAAGFLAGQVSNAAQATDPYANVLQAWVGNKTVGDANVVWAYGTINGSQNETKVGDVALNLGYDLVNKENIYFGIALRGLFGAGGASKAVNVFEPMVGTGGRMGVGGNIDAQVRLWERDEDHKFVATFSGYAVHLFNNNQVRSFDLLNCGNGSRYNLVKKLTTIAVAPAVSTYSNIDNMINIGTQKAKIGVGVVYDATLQFAYMMNNVNIDLGWSIGGRSGEKFSSFVTNVPANSYILYDSNTVTALISNALTANQTNGVSKITVAGNDTGATAAAVTTTNQATYCISSSTTTTTNGVTTAATGIGLDTASALAPSVVSNCLYLNLGYTWRDNDWCPCVSLFGNVELSNNKSVNTWGIGLQGNVSY